MKASFSLSIPKPCSENWNSFTPTLTGGFCGSCNKNVIDFTKATDDEIVAFISRKPENGCGRFRTDQLKIYELVSPDKIRPGFTLLRAGVLSLLLFFLNKQASAQFPSTTHETEVVQHPVSPDKTTSHTYTVVRGIVIDSADKSPLPGISIIQKGTTIGTQTDAEGRYELTLERKAELTLVFSFVGMKTQEVTVYESAVVIANISLVPDVTMLGGFVGGIVWTGEVGADHVYTEPKSRLKKFANKLKNLF